MGKRGERNYIFGEPVQMRNACGRSTIGCLVIVKGSLIPMKVSKGRNFIKD